jgi:peptide-methionine (S)-S-oxide reductase
MDMQNRDVATIAGGCFWCIEAIFNELKGVEMVESGYSGGDIPNPTYQQVCTGTTNHAEVVQVTYDPTLISYKELLELFFSVHDPTTLNRQGADVGTQYRSSIFYHNEDQKRIAEELIEELDRSKLWDRPIVTQLEPFKEFFKAEAYHQEYYEQNPNQPYCRAVIAPKVTKFRKEHFDRLKKNQADIA